MTADPRPDNLLPHQRFTRTNPHSQPQPQPPPGTDAPHDDADALDGWLNDRALAQRGAAAPASHDAGSNGQVLSARQFHTRFAAAEEAEAPETPVDAIWEQVMANTLIAPAPSPSPTPIASARSPERRPTRHPLLIAVGSHPAATALLVAGVMLAIVVVFRSFAHDPNGPIIDYGPAALAPGATASPTASPPAAACTVSVMTDAEAQEIVKNNSRPRAASDYLPVRGQPSVSNDDAQSALETTRGLYACDSSRVEKNVPYYLQRPSLETDALAARSVAQSTPSANVSLLEEQLTLTKALSPVLATPDPRAYVVDPTDPAILPYLTGDGVNAQQRALLPEDFVTLADGRIGAPLKTARIGGAGTENASDYLSTQTVPFLIFKEVNGQWLVDDAVALCTANCDAYYADQERQIAEMRSRFGTASPIATPSPAAAAIWLQPIDAGECVTMAPPTAPYRDYDRPRDYMVVNTSARPDVAQRNREYTACMGWGTATPQAASSEFPTIRHADEDTRRLSFEQITGAKDLSAYYTDAGFSPYQRAPEGVDFRDAHTTTSQRADEGPIVYTPIFDPANAVGLSDGRVAIPTTYLIADDRSWNQAQRQPLPITTSLTIWANVNGSWLIDEELPLCIGDCGSLWSYLESRAPDAPVTSPGPGTPASPAASAVMPIERRTFTI